MNSAGTKFPDSEDVHGAVYGVGLEYAFSQNLFAGIEVLHFDLDDHNYTVDGGQLVDVEVQPTVWRATLSYGF